MTSVWCLFSIPLSKLSLFIHSLPEFSEHLYDYYFEFLIMQVTHLINFFFWRLSLLFFFLLFYFLILLDSSCLFYTLGKTALSPSLKEVAPVGHELYCLILHWYLDVSWSLPLFENYRLWNTVRPAMRAQCSRGIFCVCCMCPLALGVCGGGRILTHHLQWSDWNIHEGWGTCPSPPGGLWQRHKGIEHSPAASGRAATASRGGGR